MEASNKTGEVMDASITRGSNSSREKVGHMTDETSVSKES
jgi:hypothetical protein